MITRKINKLVIGPEICSQYLFTTVSCAKDRNGKEALFQQSHLRISSTGSKVTLKCVCASLPQEMKIIKPCSCVFVEFRQVQNRICSFNNNNNNDNNDDNIKINNNNNNNSNNNILFHNFIRQASTSEMFGKVQEIPQTEKTPFYPRSPYGKITFLLLGTKPQLSWREGYYFKERYVLGSFLSWSPVKFSLCLFCKQKGI